MLRAGLVSVVAAMTLGACAAPQGENIATQSKVCDQEITGSHFKRCARDGSVESVSRDDLDRAGTRLPTMTRDPAGRGR